MVAPACQACRRRKVACDQLQPCTPCKKRKEGCRYGDGKRRPSAQELAAERREEQIQGIRDEIDNALVEVKELASQLNLSPDDLDDLYEQASADVAAEQEAGPRRSKRSRRRGRDDQDADFAPSTPESPSFSSSSTTASTASPAAPATRRSARVTRSSATAALAAANDRLFSSSDFSSPASQRRPPLTPPPLPPIAMDGRLHSPRMYHFPSTSPASLSPCPAPMGVENLELPFVDWGPPPGFLLFSGGKNAFTTVVEGLGT
ncbi:hypothetical protein JCM10207_003098 [Rhodosporidiobolus poonsookiae]